MERDVKLPKKIEVRDYKIEVSLYKLNVSGTYLFQ
jgi:hypothetical protein